MWIILLAPKGSFKQYFALVGVFGSIMALVHPVFIPTLSSRFLGQQCLWSLGSLGQLLDLSGSIYQVEERDVWKICQMTFGVNAIIQLANLVTGGNYGFMRRPPVLGDHGLVLQLFDRDGPDDRDPYPDQCYR